MITLLNIRTGHHDQFTFSELLEELNRDRSENWSEYTMNSTLQELVEGVKEFTEYQLIK